MAGGESEWQDEGMQRRTTEKRTTGRGTGGRTLTTTSIIMLPFPPLKLLPPSVYTSCDTTAVMKNMDTPADVMPSEMNGSAVGNTRIPSGEQCGQPRRAMKIAGT